MSSQILLIVEPATQAREPAAWLQALQVPLGSRPAIFDYTGLCARTARSTALILPRDLANAIGPPHIDGLTVHTYRRRFSDGSFSRATPDPRACETIIVNAACLPAIDLPAALAEHRSTSAGLTLFCDPHPKGYCREQIAADASGLVRRAFREYADFCPQRCPVEPLAMILSRRTFRPDPTSSIASFAHLAAHLQERVRRAGDRVRFVRHPSVSRQPDPLEALLQLIARTFTCAAPRDGRIEPCISPDAQIRGPVLLGKRVHIGPDALIVGPSALGDGVRIGAGAVVSRSILLPGETLADGGCCHHRVIAAASNRTLASTHQAG